MPTLASRYLYLPYDAVHLALHDVKYLIGLASKSPYLPYDDIVHYLIALTSRYLYLPYDVSSINTLYLSPTNDALFESLN